MAEACPQVPTVLRLPLVAVEHKGRVEYKGNQEIAGPSLQVPVKA